jgi:hypothetical protein
MAVPVASIIVLLAAVYLGAGILVAVPFALRGVSRIDPAASGAGWGFRLIIIPGAAALWPVILLRWMRPPGSATAGRALRAGHLAFWLVIAPACITLLILAFSARAPRSNDRPLTRTQEPQR